MNSSDQNYTRGIGDGGQDDMMELSNRLPASLWAEDGVGVGVGTTVEPQTGLQQGHQRSQGAAVMPQMHSSQLSPCRNAGLSAESLRMNHEDQKQAAMKTIAHLQDWATKQNSIGGPHSHGHGTVHSQKRVPNPMYTTAAATEPQGYFDGGWGGYGGLHGLPHGQHGHLPQHGQLGHLSQHGQHGQHGHLGQRLAPAHQQYEYAAVLQRIIQDYLAGKQLSMVEQQLLQQYIQMEQQKQVTQLHAQEAQQREQEMIAQRLYQEQLERLGRMGVGGIGGVSGSLSRGMTGMGGAMDPAYGMRGASGSVQSHNVGVIGGGNRPANNGHYHGGNGQQQRRSGPQGAEKPSNGSASNFKHAGRARDIASSAVTSGKPPSPAVNPVKTLQEIGRTLSELGITVEVAVNAGLLGGLSASDVRIVAEAHRVENELKGLGVGKTMGTGVAGGGTMQGMACSAPPSVASVPSEPNSPPKGIVSVPSPSSPVWSGESLSKPDSARCSVPPVSNPGGAEVDDALGVNEGSHNSSRSNSSSQKPISKSQCGSVNTSTIGDETASGSASLFGDQQKDEDSGGETIKGSADEDVDEEAVDDAKITSYLDSLSLGTSW